MTIGSVGADLCWLLLEEASVLMEMKRSGKMKRLGKMKTAGERGEQRGAALPSFWSWRASGWRREQLRGKIY